MCFLFSICCIVNIWIKIMMILIINKNEHLVRACHMPGISLAALHLLTHFILTTTIIPIWEIRKLKDVKDFWICDYRAQIPRGGVCTLKVKGEDALHVKVPMTFRESLSENSCHSWSSYPRPGTDKGLYPFSVYHNNSMNRCRNWGSETLGDYAALV